MATRDDFSELVKRTLAERVGYLCSKPCCREWTTGPHSDPAKSQSIGEAAHITGASEQGKRYDLTLTSKQRSSIQNGIWLCTRCHTIVDNDWKQFPVELLREWKKGAEDHAKAQLGKPWSPKYPNERIRALGGRLEDALARKRRLEEHCEDSSAVRDEIVQLKREMRGAGQLPEGYRLGKDRYLLIERLGQGGFGAVWLARDEQRGERVAIKILHPNLAGDPARVERFQHGETIMKRLDHAAVVRVLDPCVEEDGWHYFVMEYLPGGDLRQAVLQGRVRREQVCRLMIPVCDAVAKAHAQDIVHRDIKPENILLDVSGGLKLTDFDLVSAPDTIGGTGGTRGEAMGTFRYTAPEAADGPDPRADVFSLGMTMAFALYGRDLPHECLGRHDAVIGTLHVKQAVREVLDKATHWGSKDVRHQDAGALRDALVEAVKPRSVSQVLWTRTRGVAVILLESVLFACVAGLMITGMLTSFDYLEKSYGHSHAVRQLFLGAATLLGIAGTFWAYVRFKRWLRQETAKEP